MAFQKGNKLATKNKGIPKKRTQEWESLGEAITSRHTERFNQILETLDDEKFTERYLDVLEYFKPKLARQELTGKDGEKLETGVIVLPSKDE